MNHLKIMWRYARFYWRAQTKYTIHSPFVYGLAEALEEDNRLFYVFEEAEFLRESLLKNSKKIVVEDYGAGSLVNNSKERTIRSIAHSSLSPQSKCRMLFRLAHWAKPKNVLEMGTSLGISAIYLAAGAAPAHVLTLEGAPAIAAVAQENLTWFYMMSPNKGLRWLSTKIAGHLHPNTQIPIELLVGQFNETLPKALKQLKKIDFAFIDGNHRCEPTLQYFEQCLEYAHEESVLIFDDIHWSEDMERAWSTIKQHPKVTLTVDLFYIGIVFFRGEQRVKEHFNMIQSQWKPFSMGFWG